MNKFKGWLKKEIMKLLMPEIKELISCSESKECEANNLTDETKHEECIYYNELVGHKVEIRHFSQEESIFVNVYAVMESSTHIMSKETNKATCKSRGIVLIDSEGAVYTLSNVYEYEIRKREVFIDG